METFSSINLLIASVLLLLVASAVAVMANRMRIPYTVGLVLMGLARPVFAPAILTGETGEAFKQFLDISHNPLIPKIILGLLVQPLVFEAAYHILLEDLRKDFWMIVLFAVPGMVMFYIMLAIAGVGDLGGVKGEDITLLTDITSFARVAGGGLMVGLLLGLLTSQGINRISDPLVETTLTTVLAFGSYLVAEQMHFSGVLAVVGGGLAEWG